jgi:hypothetical protein
VGGLAGGLSKVSIDDTCTRLELCSQLRLVPAHYLAIKDVRPPPPPRPPACPGRRGARRPTRPRCRLPPPRCTGSHSPDRGADAARYRAMRGL